MRFGWRPVQPLELEVKVIQSSCPGPDGGLEQTTS